LADWYLASDCVIERWPDGSPRHLVPIAQIVVVEVARSE
jgi:hypothetical protein